MPEEEEQLTPLKIWEYLFAPDGEMPKFREEIAEIKESVSEVSNKAEVICGKIDLINAQLHNGIFDRVTEIEQKHREQELANEVKSMTVDEYEKKIRESEERGRRKENEAREAEDRRFRNKIKMWTLVIGGVGLLVAILGIYFRHFF